MTDTELLQALYNDMQTVKHKVTSMEDKVTSLDARVASLEHEILKINVTLENETNRSIQIIAEGHLDLSRKLNEAIKISSDVKAKQEIQDIYINMHQNQLRAL